MLLFSKGRDKNPCLFAVASLTNKKVYKISNIGLYYKHITIVNDLPRVVSE
jgi:hypothetical protein